MNLVARNPAFWFLGLAVLGAVAHGLAYAAAGRRDT